MMKDFSWLALLATILRGDLLTDLQPMLLREDVGKQAGLACPW